MPPTEDEVRRQLDRLLASGGFANAGRMSRFLKFVVDRTLAGEGDRLKEYVIGVEVFDRDAGYDPRVDSIVRVEAARLRSKLAEYYSGEGRGDIIMFTLPKGGYAAAIERIEPRASESVPATSGAPPAHESRRPSRRVSLSVAGALLAAAAAIVVVAWPLRVAPPSKARLAVLPFELEAHTDHDAALAQLVTEGVTAELVRAGRFSVVASSAARAEYSPERRPRDLAAALEADVIVEARLTTDGERVRVEARAANGHTEEKLWVHGFAGDRRDTDALERSIAAAIVDGLSATAIVRPQ